MTRCRSERTPAEKGGRVAGDAGAWKKTVARTFLGLELIPEKFSGELVVTFKDGGVSYLKKTETFK